MNMQKITTNSQRLASAPPKLAPIALACAMLALSTLSYSNGALAADAAADAAAAPAAADGMPLGDVQEVKVNARKQSLSAQKKSESIETLSGALIEQSAVPDITTLTPPAGAQNGKVVISPALYDMAGADVLRGPQGTLYGSGAMGGSVKLITTPPDTSGFAASLQSVLSGTQGGGFNHTDNVMLNVPLVADSMALRIVASEAFTSGWIDRIISNALPVVGNNGATRGDVQSAPVAASYPHSNAAQQYNVRMNLLWKATPQLTIAPGLYYFTSRQDGISAYDSTPVTQTHYQPFDIAEPMTDRMTIGTLTVSYAFDAADLTWNTSYWKRRSTQVQDGSEDFNNPQSGATLASNNNLSGPQPGYYGAGGTGTVVGTEDDPTRQLSEELRLASKGNGPFQWVLGAYASDYWPTWNFSGITANPSVYMDLGSNQAATTNQWFVANSPM